MKKRYLIALVVALIAAMLGVGAAVSASATPEEKVGVCHRTAAETNPYVYIEVPADEASGHVTGTDKQHNHKVYWETDGTWRGVPHRAGDERMDYLASSSADCQDIVVVTPPPPGGDDCPEGQTDYNGTEPGCGTPPVECPQGDLNGDQPGCEEEPQTPVPPKGDDDDRGKPNKPHRGGDDVRGVQSTDQPVEVPTAVAAGK